jgi:hypothetical protein
MTDASTTVRCADRAPAATPLFRPERDQVLTRMYGQGLGDCFLLAFPRAESNGGESERPVYVLIDCGVVAGTPDGPARMQEVVCDIKRTTWDDSLSPPQGHLDLLIITHEHWDHLSSFVQATEEWKQITVDALWTAWTEKENDPSGLPEVLKKILAKHRKALAEVADRGLRFGLGGRLDTALSLMAFQSDAATSGLAFSAAPGVDDAFDAAKKMVASSRHTCCEPGEILAVPGTAARAYVLGPPRSSDRLRQVNPSRKEPETYEGKAEQEKADQQKGVSVTTQRAMSRPAFMSRSISDDPALSLRSVAEGRSAFNAFTQALLGASGDASPALGESLDDPNASQRSYPFDRSVRIPLPTAETAAGRQSLRVPLEDENGADDEAENGTDCEPGALPRAKVARKEGADLAVRIPLPVDKTSLFKPVDLTPTHRGFASYFDEINHWRRIDFDWLGVAETFALQADNLTNNTSLVLAFELPSQEPETPRKVLLFVGDAQVGNWLSWDEITDWQHRDDAGKAERTPDVSDLLGRTVFYKVGHHGSHNATLKAKGVERMPAGGKMTAFVPVSVEVARELKDWCEMPLDAMLDALSTRTDGQVVLANGSIWPGGDANRVRRRIKLEVSADTLPAKTTDDGETIEPAVPLWVQIAVDF